MRFPFFKSGLKNYPVVIGQLLPGALFTTTK
nr:MAG TPA: hypothetical protein [Caudoviricetes sp.]